MTDGEPREDAARALTEWARVRGVSLVKGEELAAPTSSGGDDDIAERVEKEIARAREAVAALDVDAAERALARAERLLRDHPELLQAAWLRAEVDRTWAARFLRIEPRDEARAQNAWQHAAALDGGRVAGVGEKDQGKKPTQETTVIIAGASGTGVRVFFDGEPRLTTRERGKTSIHVKAPSAEHQLVVYDGDVVLFASWITIADGVSSIEVSVARAGSCARASFGSVVRVDEQISAEGVTCPRWIAAIPGERPGSVLVARCERDTCGPLLEWRTDRGAAGPPQGHLRDTSWPGWATWTLVGVGAMTATVVTLVATGVLEARPVEQRFIAGGARVE
jgi:hypothetical protein